MSLRELILQGGTYPTLYPSEIINSQPITVLTTLADAHPTPSQIYNGVIYSSWNGTPGVLFMGFPSLTELDNFIGTRDVGTTFTIELYVQYNAKISYTILLGPSCFNIDGGAIINTSGLNGAPRYFKIIAVRKANEYTFYSPSY